MRTNITYILVIVLLVITFIGQFFLREIKNDYKRYKISIDKHIESNLNLDIIIKDQLYFTGRIIRDWKLIDIKNNIIHISEVNKKDCSFLLLSEYTCFDCVEACLDELNKIKKNKNINIVIICGFSNFNKVRNWAKFHNNFQNIYLLKEIEKSIFFEKANFPYLFKLNTDLQIANVYSASSNLDYLPLFLE